MRRFAAVVLGATLLALPACGSKTDETSRAAGITPPNALAMVSVNLSPSIEQKRKMLSIARRFPGARDTVKGEFDNARDELLGEILEESGLDFARDVKPWLGKEAAVVVLPPGDADSPLFVAMVQTDDEEKAKAAIAKATTNEDFEGVYAIVDDFVVISEQEDEADNQRAIDQITAQANKGDGGLAESAEFTSVVDKLAGDRLVLGWVDAEDAIGVAEDLGAIDDIGFLRGFGTDASTVAFDLHVEDKAVVFQGVASATGADKGSSVELTRSLPATTLAALTMFDVGKGVTDAIKAVTGAGGPDVTAEFEESTGISVANDILSWMQGEVVVVAGAVRDGQPFPDFALVVEPSDEAKAAAGVTKIRDSLANQGLTFEERKVGGTTAYVAPEPFAEGIQPAMALFPDRFVLANSPAYLDDLSKASTAGLGASDAYTSVLGDNAKDTTGQFVALLDPIREALEKGLLPEVGDTGRSSYEEDVKPNLEPLAAFGARSHREGAFHLFEMRLTFD